MPSPIGADWDEFYLGLAAFIAQRSKDPSTKVGSVIVRPDKTVISMGYNGFARGIEDSMEDLQDRDTKLRKVIHAEMNAILHSNENLQGCIQYIWPYCPCERCAAHMIQAGIKWVVFPSKTIMLGELNKPKEYKDAYDQVFNFAIDEFGKAGVKVVMTHPRHVREKISQWKDQV